MLKKIVVFANLFLFSSVFSQEIVLTENAKVSILTCGTSPEPYALYGHTAIRFQDKIQNIDTVYNYGTFDFATPNFVLRFVKGDLQYFVSATSFEGFMYSYRAENRTVIEQELQLTTAEKQALYTSIYQSLYSEERFYTYKFIDKNCTTMILDKVSEAIDEKVITTKKIKEKTYREILLPYTNEQFYQQLGIHIIFGKKVDNVCTKPFLPFDFLESLKETQHNKQPLVKQTLTLFEAQPTKTPFSILDSVYSFIFVLVLLVIINKKPLTLFYFSILGILGLFFIAVGFYSLHQEVLWNYNVLLFNPLYLLLVFFILQKNSVWISKIRSYIRLFLFIYVIYMFNKVHLALVVPIIITNLMLLSRTKSY